MKENKNLSFLIIEVMESLPEKKGNYLYGCRVCNMEWEPTIYNYHEQDLLKTNQKTPTLLRIAYHEAGHAVACNELRIKIKEVSIIPDSTTYGRVNIRSSFDTPDLGDLKENSAKIEKYLIAILAGAAAEKVKFGKVDDTSSSNDYEVCFGLASKLFGSMKLTSAYVNFLQIRAESLFSYLDDDIEEQPDTWKQVEALAIHLLQFNTVSGRGAKRIMNSILR